MAAGRDSDNRRLGHRRARSPGVGVLAALEGAALIVWNLVATPFIGRRRLRWGTVGTEATDSLPGDELVPEPKWSYTLGIAVDASPEDVWPWIAQLGQGRGGFYTYQTLENIAGCRITNTTEILPDHQHPKVGEDIHLHPTASKMRIEIVDPPNALVLSRVPGRYRRRGELGNIDLAVRRQPRPRWRQPVPDQGPLRLHPGLEEPPRVWTLPDRSDHVRDEPQDDARDQEAGRARRLANAGFVPDEPEVSSDGSAAHNTRAPARNPPEPSARCPAIGSAQQVAGPVET